MASLIIFRFSPEAISRFIVQNRILIWKLALIYFQKEDAF